MALKPVNITTTEILRDFCSWGTMTATKFGGMDVKASGTHALIVSSFLARHKRIRSK
jgi:hypothetical protein